MAVPKLRFKADDGSDYPDLEETKLDTLMAFKNGINASGDKFGRGTKCISVMDILNNSCITYDVIKGEVDVDEKTLQNFTVEYGDAVFQRSSENVQDAGRANVYMDKDRPATFSGFVIRGKRIANYEPMFMNGLLNAFSVRKQIMSKAQGAQHINIGQEILSSVRVNMPSLPEQQKIADFLSMIDTVIEKQKATIGAWEERKKGVMQKLFSQEVRFKADDGSEFPEWEEKKLKNILKEYKEYSAKDGSYEHVSLTKEGVVPKSERYERDFLVKDVDKKYRITHLGDICYNPANLKFGVICRNKYGDGIFSPIYVTFHVCKDMLPEFVEMLVTRRDFIEYALKYQQGTVYERMSVSPDDLLSIKVMVPCMTEQQKIADCLSALDDVIEKQKATLAAWEEMKKGLLQQMFV
jgi:type I restriction enzyme S subunit